MENSKTTASLGNDSASGGDTSTRAAAVLRDQLAAPLDPGLYLVATPIGNLADVSLRALSVLSGADIVACEDTRHSRKLLSHYAIKAKLVAYHEHNAAAALPKLLAALKKGARIALISDAGTPLISDPGYRLVHEAAAAEIPVTAIPGASASLAALSVSGLPTDCFFFAGFLPPKAAARRTRLDALKTTEASLIFYETGPRLDAALSDMEAIFGDREGAIARELTKLHEEVARGSLKALAETFAPAERRRGEFVIVVGPARPADAAPDDAEIEAALKTALAESSLKDAAKAIAEAYGLPRNRVYRLGLKLAGKAGKAR